MEIKDLVPAEGSKTISALARGPASGHGKTAGRGMNGQLSRSGGGKRLPSKGGQTPLAMRLPKLLASATSTRVEYAAVNVSRPSASLRLATSSTPSL